MKRLALIMAVVFLFGTNSTPSQASNTYWVPGTGIGSLTFAQDCSLGQLVVDVVYDTDSDGSAWDSNGLFFRKRDAGGDWQGAEPIDPWVYEDSDAALFNVNRGGGPLWEAYVMYNVSLTRYQRDANGTWSETHSVNVTSTWPDIWSPNLLSAHLGSDNRVYLAVLTDDMVLSLLTFDGTSFSSEVVATFSNRTIMWGFDDPHQLRPRNLSMALDKNNTPHIAFSVDQVIQGVVGGTFQASKVFYATKNSGNWQISTPINPGDNPHDAGLGLSLGIAPDGTVAMASTYLPRAFTGSPGVAQLRYLYKNANGGWVSEVITQTSDGYRSRDGEQGTGLYPHLKFDGASRPHIVFTDHASEHVGTAWSYSGQMRYATRDKAASGKWKVQTIIAQPTGDAFLRRLDYPVLAVTPKQCGYYAVAYALKEEFTENPFYRHYSTHFRWLPVTEPPVPPPPPPPDGEPMPWLFLLLD